MGLYCEKTCIILLHPEKYLTTKVLTATRGCPNTCTFCSAGIGLLKKYRKRSVEKVIAELEQVPGKLAIFFDDNIGWEPEFAKALFRAMIPLRKTWFGLSTVKIAEDPELLELCARSACAGTASFPPTPWTIPNWSTWQPRAAASCWV